MPRYLLVLQMHLLMLSYCDFYFLRTHCALQHFISYAMTTSRLQNRNSYPFALKIKHLYSDIHNDSNHVFPHLCVRIFIGSTIRPLKAFSCLVFFGNQQNSAI